MTTEEKAKRYDEALNWMRELYPGLHGATKEDAEHFFPELRESEDERIRKLLVWQVYRNIEDDTNDLAQSVYDGIKGHDPDIEESIEDWKKCLAYLEKQKEQKPAEWSDTNELVFKDICKHLKEEGYNGWIVLLEALRNGEFQPKQKWSEEDERAINCACVALRAYAHGDLPEFLPSELMGYADRLQSLRLDSYKNCNSRWKPSEEQLEALRKAVNKLADTEVADSVRLSIMYDHLKELV